MVNGGGSVDMIFTTTTMMISCCSPTAARRPSRTRLTLHLPRVQAADSACHCLLLMGMPSSDRPVVADAQLGAWRRDFIV